MRPRPPELYLSLLELTFVILLGGAVLGALSVTYLGDKLGRKRMIFLGSLFAVFGCTLQGGAATIGMLIAGRFFAGIAVGQLSSTVPVYGVSYRISSSPTILLTNTVVGDISSLDPWSA
jgi:MFS family permease